MFYQRFIRSRAELTSTTTKICIFFKYKSQNAYFLLKIDVKQTLSQKGIDIWNSLQSDIKDITSCTAFKKQFKQHLLLNPT